MADLSDILNGSSWIHICISITAGFVGIRILNQQRRLRKLPKGVRYPPHVQSWIPVLGSALELTNTHLRQFVLGHSKKLGNPKVFTANIAGDKCAFLPDSDLTYVVFKDSIKEIDSLTLQKRAMSKLFGHTSEELKQAFPENNHEMGKTAMKQIHHYLISKEQLEKSLGQVQEILYKNIQGQLSQQQTTTATTDKDSWVQVPLLKFCREIIFFASVGPLISNRLMKEEVIQDYYDFEFEVPLLFADVPSFMTKKSRSARERMIKSLGAIPGDQAEFMEARQELFTKAGFSGEQQAKANFGMLFAAISNSIPSVFWSLCNIMEDPKCYQACKQVVEQVASKREAGRTWFTMDELDEMAVLKSAFMETLRIYQLFFVVREVENDFIVNPKAPDGEKIMIEKGTRLMGLPNVVHMDPDIFEDPEVFKYDRFVDPKAVSKKGTLLTSHWKPFGGGAHLCPGRKFITYEFQALLAMILLEMDMEFAENESKPKINLERQGVSVAQPLNDVLIQVRPRQSP